MFSSPFALPQHQPNPSVLQPSHDLLIYGTITRQAYNESAVKSVVKDRSSFEPYYEYEESSDPIRDARELAALVQRAPRYIAADPEIQMGHSLPPKFIPDSQTSGMTIRFIMVQYEPLFELVFFRPIQNHIHKIRQRFVTRIMSSSFTHCSMYIGAQMFRTLRQDGEHADVGRFVPWIERLGQLSTTAKNDVTLDDLVGRLAGALEIAFLKHITSSTKSSYTLLRHIAPLFMQVAFADPALWPRDPSSNGISLAHALESPLYELGRFIFTDTVSSLTLGTPPLVEYDTSHPITRTHGDHPLEMIHGWPPEFVFFIMRISQWRAKHPNGYLDEDNPWEEIEKDTLAWRPMRISGSDSDSSRQVTRFAVQESWKHGLLIYLYMGMCGVTSHDPRVQSSVRQISLLYATIRSPSVGNMHLTVPFLIAGVCARNEADRRKFRQVVSNQARRKASLAKTVDFGPVLDHLWHGVGVNGGPVTWDDYIRSRKAVVDIGI